MAIEKMNGMRSQSTQPTNRSKPEKGGAPGPKNDVFGPPPSFNVSADQIRNELIDPKTGKFKASIDTNGNGKLGLTEIQAFLKDRIPVTMAPNSPDRDLVIALQSLFDNNTPSKENVINAPSRLSAIMNLDGQKGFLLADLDKVFNADGNATRFSNSDLDKLFPRERGVFG